MLSPYDAEYSRAAGPAAPPHHAEEGYAEYFGGYRAAGCNSDDACVWDYPGETTVTHTAAASRTDVAVGVTIVYTEPYTQEGKSFPGVVVITQLLCAAATAVAKGENTPTSTIGVADTGGARARMHTSMATGEGGVTLDLVASPGNYALDGFKIAHLPTGGATQLAVTFRHFAHNEPAAGRASSRWYPYTATEGSQNAEIGCSSSSSDLYLSDITWAGTDNTPTTIGHLRAGCTDYADAFQMPTAGMVACCKGGGENCWWGPGGGYYPQSAACDAVMSKYCPPLCSGGSCTDSACNCLGSPLAADGTAQCFDARCADNASAYRTAAMSKDPKCPGESLTCAEFAVLGPSGVAKGAVLPSGCPGPPAPPPSGGILAWLQKNPTWAIIFVVFLILAAFALAPPSSGRGRSRKLPPGALPELPSLGEI
jgi:hypothetical protein